MTRILWVSRHAPTQPQVDELQQVFGPDVEVIQESITIGKASEVKDLMERYNAAEVVAVLPVHLLAELTRLGIRPIRAVMERQLHNDGSVDFIHQRFERVERVEIVTSPLL